jgi:hypothetical protein
MSLAGKLRKKGVEIESPNDASVYKGHLQISGRLITVDTTEVRVLIYDNDKDVFLCSGETIPTNGEDGFAKGCLFVHISAAVNVKALYENIGTKDSCEFNAIGAITEDEIVLPEAELLIGNSENVAESQSITGVISISAAGVATLSLGVIMDNHINANAAINATKIADGSISNTEFQYLNGVTSGIQGQLNAITALADGMIYIGDATGQAAEKSIGGDVLMTREGVVTINSHAADVLVATDKKIQFRDTAIYLQSNVDGALSVVADGHLNLTADRIKHNGLLVKSVNAPAAKTTAVTLTASEIIGGLITGEHTAGANQNYTLPTGEDLDTALVTFDVGHAFEFSIINISAAVNDTITVLGNTGMTLVGNGLIDSLHTSGMHNSSGRFLVRKTAADTFTCYRL